MSPTTRSASSPGSYTPNTTIVTVAEIRRDDIEAFKVWLAAQPGNKPATTLSFNTQRQRLGMLRVFFERIIEWEWDDAPRRNPVIGRDLPPRPDPLPKVPRRPRRRETDGRRPSLESACETCSYFATGPEFVLVLLRQRDHARDHQQTERADLFDSLINRAQQCS